jgi:hypothetical protein
LIGGSIASTPAYLLDENAFGGGVAKREPSSIDLTKDGAVARNFCDERLFAESHLTNSLAEFRRTGQFADPTERSSRQLAQRHKALWDRSTHHKVIETRFQ